MLGLGLGVNKPISVGGAEGFTPNRFGLNLWVNPDTAVSDNLWEDASGNNNDLTEATNAPIYNAIDADFNELSSYTFPASAQLNATTNISISPSTNGMLFAVVKLDNTASNFLSFRTENDDDSRITIAPNSVNLLSNTIDFLSKSINTTTTCALIINIVAGKFKVYINGSYYGYLDSTTALAFDFKQIFSTATVANRKIAELGIKNDNYLTTTQINQLTQYLQLKYNLNFRTRIVTGFPFYFNFELS